jgi:hypothetical protein
VKTVTADMRHSSLRILSLPGREFTGNPYIDLFCDALERAGMSLVNIHTSQARLFKFDILHLHWPQHYVTERPIYKALIFSTTLIIYMMLTKLLRKSIVWTVHDVKPMRARHPRLLRLHLAYVRASVDAYVFMNPSSASEFTEYFPRARKKLAWQVPHGPYPVPPTSPQHAAALRFRFSGGTDCLIVGFLGDIRPYKNAEMLAYLPPRDLIGRDIKILVAGAADSTYDIEEIEAPLKRIPPKQLVRIPERLSDQCLADIIRAVDLVLLPYLWGSNSGFGMFVLSCGQRLLCSALPMFTDLANDLGPPWIYIFDHEAQDLLAELERGLSRFQHDQVGPEAKIRLQRFLEDRSFDHGAQQLRRLYERLGH